MRAIYFPGKIRRFPLHALEYNTTPSSKCQAFFQKKSQKVYMFFVDNGELFYTHQGYLYAIGVQILPTRRGDPCGRPFSIRRGYPRPSLLRLSRVGATLAVARSPSGVVTLALPYSDSSA